MGAPLNIHHHHHIHFHLNPFPAMPLQAGQAAAGLVAGLVAGAAEEEGPGPPSLLSLALEPLAMQATWSAYKPSLATLPPALLFRLFRRLYLKGRLCQLGYELGADLRLFDRLLALPSHRYELHQMFQVPFPSPPPLLPSPGRWQCRRCGTTGGTWPRT